MTEIIKTGQVGMGFAGEYYIECLKKIYGTAVEITGVNSLREKSRNAFGSKYSVTVYDTVTEMLNYVDVLIICSPPYMCRFYK